MNLTPPPSERSILRDVRRETYTKARLRGAGRFNAAGFAWFSSRPLRTPRFNLWGHRCP